jgi:hypothetical protein
MRRLLAAAALIFALGCGDDDDPTSPNDASVILRNQTSDTIDEFYYSTCSDELWGANRLGSTALASGQSRTFSLDAGCWDFRVVRADGFEELDFGNELEANDVLELIVAD